jgi:hypothetical protein
MYPSVQPGAAVGLPAVSSLLPRLGSASSGRSIPRYRAINDIIAHVTVEEDASDELVITEHPVEYGAAITDHAYKRPSEVRLRVGWSESGGLPNQFSTAVSDVRTVYDQILALQMSRVPFTLYTGKKTYENMLVADIRVSTNSATENVLIADVTLRQILLVRTQTKPGSAAPGHLADPMKNSDTQQNGEKQPIAKTATGDQVTDYGGNLRSAVIVQEPHGVLAAPEVPAETFGGGGGLTPPGQLPEVPSGPLSFVSPFARRR